MTIMIIIAIHLYIFVVIVNEIKYILIKLIDQTEMFI